MFQVLPYGSGCKTGVLILEGTLVVVVIGVMALAHNVVGTKDIATKVRERNKNLAGRS